MEGNNDTNNVVTTTNDVDGNVSAEKTYVKQDIDNSYNAGYKKGLNELQKNAEYKEFMEWKKSNQNDAQKLAELETSNTSLANENKLLKAQMEVSKSSVNPKMLKFVTNEIMNLVDDKTDFATALDNYKKSNPEFFGEQVIKKVQTSPVLTGGTVKTTTNDIMNSLIRGK